MATIPTNYSVRVEEAGTPDSIKDVEVGSDETITKQDMGAISSETNEVEHPPIHVQMARATKNGGGMFVEAFYVFAVGQLTTLWKVAYPQCVEDAACNEALGFITWVQVACIIASQLSFGIIADVFGRKIGSRLTAMLMLIGAILLVFSFGVGASPGEEQTVATLTGQFQMTNVALAIFSLGIGGEYPMSSTMAAERSEHEAGLDGIRGRTIGLVFAHQGWGNLAFALVYMFLLTVTGTGGCTLNMAKNISSPEYLENCNLEGLEITWRVAYGFGLIPVVLLTVYRFWCLSEMKMFEARQEKYSMQDAVAQRKQRLRNIQIIFTNREYLIRFIGAAGTWYVQDFAFYGNKLFQGTITGSVLGRGSASNVSLLANAEFTALVGFVALVGYYAAAFTLDFPWMGRVRMQSIGFVLSGVFFMLCGGLSNNNVQVFETLYLLASFFQQYGPNVVTWILPVELFPTDVRAEAHGFCAATGKLGALTATLLFTYASPFSSSANVFWCCGAFMLAGFLLTLAAVPETGQESLRTLDRRFSIDRRGGANNTSSTAT